MGRTGQVIVREQKRGDGNLGWPKPKQVVRWIWVVAIRTAVLDLPILIADNELAWLAALRHTNARFDSGILREVRTQRLLFMTNFPALTEPLHPVVLPGHLDTALG